jgi:hypothetical protein
MHEESFLPAYGSTKVILLRAFLRELRVFVVNFLLKVGAQRGLPGKQLMSGSH